jgi:hypothetical protein
VKLTSLTGDFVPSPGGENIPQIYSADQIELPLEYWNSNREQGFLKHAYFSRYLFSRAKIMADAVAARRRKAEAVQLLRKAARRSWSHPN